MAHYGMLRDYRFSSDVDDIRGASRYGNRVDITSSCRSCDVKKDKVA